MVNSYIFPKKGLLVSLKINKTAVISGIELLGYRLPWASITLRHAEKEGTVIYSVCHTRKHVLNDTKYT